MARKKATKPMTLFHITHPDCEGPIMREGLKGGTTPRNRGKTMAVPCVFALVSDDLDLCDVVAAGQIWIDEDIPSYVVLRIDPAGITGPVKPDGVAERTAMHHRIIEQDVIAPQHLSVCQRRQFDFPGKRISEMRDFAFFQRKLSEEEWAIVRRYLDGTIIRLLQAYEASRE